MQTPPMPPQLEAACQHLAQTLEKVEGRKLDLLKESWANLEKACIKIFKGPFNPKEQEHQIIALGLAGVLGLRLSADHGAFWFPNRDTPEGAALGFPDALVTLAPFNAVMESLLGAKLERLDDVTKEIRTSLAQAKFGGASGAMRLGPEDYMRLFDPGFIQLVSIDEKKAGPTWNSTTPQRLSIDVREGISRANKLPPEVKKQLEQQLIASLARLEQGTPLAKQVARAPRVCELMGLLTGSVASTGCAPEEFWVEVVMPLLFIGAPEKFPELEGDELAAAKQGVDPLFLFLDVVPWQFKAPEEGMLGAFPGDSLAVVDPAFSALGGHQRLIKVDATGLKEPLQKFDAAKTRDALKRFGDLMKAKVGPVQVQVQGEAEAKQMFDAALTLLQDLRKVADGISMVCVRRLTEAEAASEPALSQLRAAMQGPRIILT